VALAQQRERGGPQDAGSADDEAVHA
jgi:hypothetical protein